MQTRIQISPDVIKKAVSAAARAADSDQINDWNDTGQPYLTLRQRGRSVRWLVRAYGRSRTIGSATGQYVISDYLGLRDARERAKAIYADMQASRGGEASRPTAWTLSRVCLAYQAMISRPRWINNRLKPASAGTADDVRRAFAQPSYQSLGPVSVTELNRPLLNAARDGISSFRQRQKNVAYVRAALTWAADTHPDESGLTESVDRWWERLTAGDPDADTMHAIEKRRAQHRAHKAALDVDAIGEILVRHETYCARRTAEEKISPGVRYGLWWVCTTANRRLSTVKLLREDLLSSDPLDPAMGRAMWPADTMKAKIPFWLPLPPVVRDVALGSIADYTATIAKSHGEWPSRWVFASTRRYGRDPDNDDVSIYPNSLNRHLARMRAAKALKGLPYFSLHLARSVMANFLNRNVSPIASSLVLAHTLPQSAEESSPTTREYYLTSQRMDVKRAAMLAWSEALTAAVAKAGGTLPAPRETSTKR